MMRSTIEPRISGCSKRGFLAPKPSMSEYAQAISGSDAASA